MKSTTNLLFLFISLFIFNSCKEKGVLIEPNFPKEPGYVTFNLGDNTFQNHKNQTIMLFGCNTALTNSSPHWHGMPDFQWNKSDQVLSKVPHGHKYVIDKKDTILSYHINKYYVASPPVMAPKNSKWGRKLDIGLVIPDQFTFDGDNPVQEIYLDYTPLVPQYIYLIPLNIEASITNRGVKHIPFKVECANLPWNPTNRIKNGEGASGIGAYIPGGTGFNSPNFFLPYTKDGDSEKFLDTEVTLLNDIMLYYEYKFRVPQVSNGNIRYKDTATINVKEYFKSIEQYYDKKKDSITDTKMMVTIVAKKRATGDIPCGCKPPIVKDGPYGE